MGNPVRVRQRVGHLASCNGKWYRCEHKYSNAAFQRMMEDLRGPVQDCADPFMDDNNIWTGTQYMSEDELIKAHKKDLRQLLDVLHRHQMERRPTKASLFNKEGRVCGTRG